MARVLVVDDEEGFREFMVEALETAGHEVTEARDGLEALTLLRRSSFHVLVTDLKMPRMDGLALLKKVREEQPELEVLVLTAHGSVGGAVEAMRLGAFDYLEKPLESPDTLRLLVERAAERRALKDSREGGESATQISLTWGAPSMVPVLDALRRVARTDATVLLLGESGVGKEVAAQSIHRWSSRAQGPFVAVNCAAFSEALLESELFGHEKGAFTGAVQQRRGRLELADGGTFFLDEVGELKLELQARLLRVIQEKKFERLGGSRTMTTDVRWVAATNRDLTAMIKEGSFREDLYHRLSVFPVKIPPLRERREDIVPLAEHLLVRVARDLGRPGLSLNDEARAALKAAPWSGNVRELANTLERAAILSDDRILGGDVLSLVLPSQVSPATAARPDRIDPGQARAVPGQMDAAGQTRTLEDMEREAIRTALEQMGGNRKRTAEVLGIGLRTLYEKLKRYDLG